MTDIQKRIEAGKKVTEAIFDDLGYGLSHQVVFRHLSEQEEIIQELTAREAKAVKALEAYQSIIPALKEVDDLVAQKIAKAYAMAHVTLEELRDKE